MHHHRPACVRLLLLTVPALFAACGSVPTKTFRFDAIGADEKPLPAIVVVGDDWIGAAQKKQFVNVGNKDDELSLPLTFDRGSVEVTVAAVEINPDTGEPERVPRSRMDRSDYVAEPRRIEPTDPVKALFILQRR